MVKSQLHPAFLSRVLVRNCASAHVGPEQIVVQNLPLPSDAFKDPRVRACVRALLNRLSVTTKMVRILSNGDIVTDDDPRARGSSGPAAPTRRRGVAGLHDQPEVLIFF